MCGFAGVFSRDLSREILYEIVDKMSDSLNHRGPDDRGNWTDYNLGLSISHQRLSILDLTISGRQPMVSKNKRFVLAFNGEIYNHFDLRNELKNNFKKNNWRSTSDTEVLLECISFSTIISPLVTVEVSFCIFVCQSIKTNCTL